jgi:hypothetical protein
MARPRKPSRPSGPAASSATDVRYGPRKTVVTLVLNTDIAQS